jgi:hypothetical protein
MVFVCLPHTGREKIMNSKMIASAIAVATFTGIASSQAALVSYYNFNTLSIETAGTPSATGTTTISPSTGTGSISLANFAGNVDDFAGTTTNALNSDPAEESLSLIAGGTSDPFPGNGGSVDINFSLTGLENPILTFASRNTSTGFNGNTLSYSVNGGAFNSIPGTVNLTTSFAVITFDLSNVNALDQAANVTLRYSLVGATSSSGNNRIDNLQINATAVPEPTTLGLLGAAGLMALRRRRA